MIQHRSGCPINLSLEILGDKWTLIVVRDIALGHRRHFREILTNSEEGIAANMLADRLKLLMAHGLLTRTDDPSHKQKAIYSLTEAGIELLPVLAQLIIWGRPHTSVSKSHAVLAKQMEEGGIKLQQKLMQNLRRDHLGKSS